MTLTIHLPDEKNAVLAARARAKGLSAEEYARLVLEQDLETSMNTTQGHSITALFHGIWGDLTDEDRAKLPRDGASQVDHYVYGLPKREK